MKRFMSILIVLSVIITMCIPATAAATIKVKVNNQVVDFKSCAPYRSASGIMVPVSEAAKAAGAKVEYVKNTNEVKVTYGNTILIFQAGRSAVLVNGKTYKMEQEATFRKSKTYVPVRFLFEKMGGTVKWDTKTNTVLISLKKPVPTPSPAAPDKTDDINVAMPADKDFKPFIAELTPVDPEVLKELQAYKDNKDGKLKYGINEYTPNAKVMERLGIEEIKKVCIFTKSMMEVENNVDYRNIGSNYIQQYRYFFMPESGQTCKLGNKSYPIEEYINLRYKDIIKYKIILKSEFLTDTSLAYCDKNGEYRIRGRLKFMFESVDSSYFKDYGLPTYELNKWYNADMEVSNAIFFTHNDEKWPHSYQTYRDRANISNVVLP